MIKLFITFLLFANVAWGANDIVLGVLHPGANSITWVSGGGNNLVATFGVGPTSPPPLGISNLVAHWKLNDNAETTAVTDNTGVNDGTATNLTSAMSVAGKINQAFDLSKGYTTIPDSVSLSVSTGFTIVVWYNPPSFGGTKIAICKGSDTQGTMSYGLTEQSAIGGFMSTSGGWQGWVGTTVGLTTGTWTHVAYTYDGATQTIYSNAVQVWSTATSGNVFDGDGANAELCIGAKAVFHNEPSISKMDDVRIYDRALTPSEISLIYNNGSGTELE